MPGPVKTRCTVEVVDPDDILVLGINNKWFRTFTSSSDRYPCKVEVPGGFLNDGWNLITGEYTNVALVGKNDASVEYKVQLEDMDVVHVIYRTEVQPHTFSVAFKDTFSIKQRKLNRGEATGARGSKRFQQMMAWQQEGNPPGNPPPPPPPPG